MITIYHIKLHKSSTLYALVAIKTSSVQCRLENFQLLSAFGLGKSFVKNTKQETTQNCRKSTKWKLFCI